MNYGTKKFGRALRRAVHGAHVLLLPSLVLAACAKSTPVDEPGVCVSELKQSNAGSSGRAYTFGVDPMVSSGNPTLSPVATTLDSLKREVTLNHLGSRGVLEGQFVDVRDGVTCNGGFHAEDAKQAFLYDYTDSRFQEAMTYSEADGYRATLSGAGVLLPADPVKIVVHCMKEDNAYFIRSRDSSGVLIKEVCLGDSVETPGASYADDSSVVLHELQHANTVDTYHPTVELNQLWYDEAGALNEAISDFMSLAYLEPRIPLAMDPRLFSRWALGQFIPEQVAVRGAHLCPQYDSTFPVCSGYRAEGAAGFSVQTNTVSYTYPDGLGWPHANNFVSPGFLRSAFLTFGSQEEIHNTGTLMAGALYDVYEALKTNLSGNAAQAFSRSSQLVVEAIRNLPKPTLSNKAPVSFRGFAAELITAATTLGFTASQQSAVTAALTQRGLLGGTLVPSGWAGLGTGTLAAPGLKITDNSGVLKGWYSRMGIDARKIPSTLRVNGKFDPGEVGAVWFDILNGSAVSAGGVTVTVTSPDSDLQVLDNTQNIGALPGDASQPQRTRAQVVYSKVNGTAIVTALSSSNNTLRVPTSNSYFATNPYFDRSFTTAIFMKASATAVSGKTVTLEVRVKPTNGAEEVLSFPVTIQ